MRPKPEIVPFVLIRPGETRMVQIARFAPDSDDTINRDISTPEVSLAHVSCRSVYVAVAPAVLCGEGCTRMFYGASGLGVARGEIRKGPVCPPHFAWCVLVKLDCVYWCVYRRLHGKASYTGDGGGGAMGGPGTEMLTSHGEKFASQGSPNAKYSCIFFLSFFFPSPIAASKTPRGRIPAK